MWVLVVFSDGFGDVDFFVVVGFGLFVLVV